MRFGAYHIYFPGLLKPAARALASLLWAEKQDNVDMSALSGAQHLASSGRTSFPVDKALHRDAYRLLGYRQCGERAVRVDILERLADLIRPALAWRETSPGEKPTGAFDGRGFVVTQAMTSLTGSAGEDFASILRALGYRMDKRPPLPPKPAPEVVVETVAAETPPVEASAESNGRDSGRDAGGRSRRRTADLRASPCRRPRCCPTSRRCPSRAKSPRLRSRPHLSKPQPRPAGGSRDRGRACRNRQLKRQARLKLRPSLPPRAKRQLKPQPLKPLPPKPLPLKPLPQKPSPMTPAEPCSSKSGGPAAVPRSAARITTATASAITPARPKARQPQPAAKAPRARRASSAIAVAAATTSSAKPREGAPADAAATPAAAVRAHRRREVRQDRPPRERFEGKGRDGDRRDKFDRNKGDRNKGGGGRDKGERGGRDFGGRDKGGRDKRDSGPSHRQWATSAAPRERDRPVDPNSPFAKLAALKEQLAGNRKE